MFWFCFVVFKRVSETSKTKKTQKSVIDIIAKETKGKQEESEEENMEEEEAEKEEDTRFEMNFSNSLIIHEENSNEINI